MVEVNDEDRIKAEMYFNEQQQLQNQQGYYGPINTSGPQIIATTAAGTIQLDHQLFAMAQSPRLKPITIVDKQVIANTQQAINNVLTAPNGFISNQKFKTKNPYDKINQARYRNLYWFFEFHIF